ncbi:MAG: flagellar motor switch protein FliM [Cellvibrionales bacterium]|nr:MAG: flagellar motor switch protein FliM [Cellvibrionales bacterium]
METNEVLTQGEIDALLSGVEDSSVPTETGTYQNPGEVQLVDFSNQSQLLNSGIPALNVAHERFALDFCESISNTMRCASTVEFAGTHVVSFIDYLNSMELPTYINFINLKPMSGLALAVFDANLIGALVDRFFGGGISYEEATSSKRDFTPAEKRMGNMLLQSAFTDLVAAWQSLLPLEPELVQTETNPDFAHLLNPSEPLMLNTFDIKFDNGGGKFQLAIPHTMIEPLQDRLVSVYKPDTPAINGAWAPIIVEEIKSATMQVASILGQAELTVKEILDLTPGDVIPLEVKDKVTLYAEGIPVFMGEFGASNGKNAIKVTSKVTRQ